MKADRRLVWSLAWRFVRGRRTRLLAGTTWAALLATALGVAAMVIAMALMTGYREDLRTKLVQGSAAIAAYPQSRPDEARLRDAREAVMAVPGVEDVRVVAYGQGSLASRARPDGVDVTLRGIDDATKLDPVCSLEMQQSRPTEASVVRVVAGRELYRKLEVGPAEPLKLMVLVFGAGRPAFRYRTAAVTATCATGFTEFDRQWVLLDRRDLEEILGPGAALVVLEITVEHLADTEEAVAGIKQVLGPGFLVSDYLDLNRELFAALRLQQLMLFLVLGLIVCVSTFNTASSLVVMVRERRRDLGVLSALGLAPEEHREVFLRYGLILGLFGTLLGTALGSGIAWAMNEFELIRFEPEMAAIYFLSAVPFRVVGRDLLAIGLFTLVVTLVACWIPARRAGKLEPAEALRYE